MSSSTSDWVKFFTAAGIPSKYAAKYAGIFSDHRIQKDMLKDLNKELLYDMGIKTMGDVIAITRYAKEYEEEESRRLILGRESPASTTVKKSVPAPTTKVATTSASSGLSSSLQRRLGTTGVKRTVVEMEEGDGIPIKKRITTPTVNSQGGGDRVVRLPTLSSSSVTIASSSGSSVFARLGGSASSAIGVTAKNGSTNSLTSGGALRRTISLAGGERTGKITATVKPTIKDRLGSTAQQPKVSFEVVSSNIKIKGDPHPSAPISSRIGSTKTMIPLKKSIFDRLGD